MDMFCIEGGRRLDGSVHVDGSKNASLPIMAASLMVAGQVTLERVPNLVDVATMIQLLRSMGADVCCQASPDSAGGLCLTIDSESAENPLAPYELVSRMRASICVLGPLIARFGRACVSLPGGCNIGHRPIDLHLRGLAALGADLQLKNGYVLAEATRLRGADIVLSGPQGSTVTGTCNILSAAATADGTTVIRAAACEPEVVALGNFLNSAGAVMHGLGTPVIEIVGVESLRGVRHRIVGDRIEAATLMMAAAITNGDIVLNRAPTESMANVISVLRDIGLQIDILSRPVDGEASLRVRRSGQLRPQDVVAVPYPGWPTDAQAQLMALLSLVPGTSVVTDRVFPDRFIHASELIRMGADIRVNSGSAVIRGADQLTAATVMASDLRASAALVLAGLAASGTSCIRRVYHLDRGYVRFEEKLNSLGADIRRVHSDQSDL